MTASIAELGHRVWQLACAINRLELDGDYQQLSEYVEELKQIARKIADTSTSNQTDR